MKSLVYIDAFGEKDVIAQMGRCSYDVHVQEILGTLMTGATLVMLRPRGTLDLEYLSTVFEKKQITYMQTVPSLLHTFFAFVEESNKWKAVQYLRSIFSGGE
jgi:non-ribosomal peptide synthetase component F